MNFILSVPSQKHQPLCAVADGCLAVCNGKETVVYLLSETRFEHFASFSLPYGVCTGIKICRCINSRVVTVLCSTSKEVFIFNSFTGDIYHRSVACRLFEFDPLIPYNLYIITNENNLIYIEDVTRDFETKQAAWSYHFDEVPTKLSISKDLILVLTAVGELFPLQNNPPKVNPTFLTYNDLFRPKYIAQSKYPFIALTDGLNVNLLHKGSLSLFTVCSLSNDTPSIVDILFLDDPFAIVVKLLDDTFIQYSYDEENHFCITKIATFKGYTILTKTPHGFIALTSDYSLVFFSNNLRVISTWPIPLCNASCTCALNDDIVAYIDHQDILTVAKTSTLHALYRISIPDIKQLKLTNTHLFIQSSVTLHVLDLNTWEIREKDFYGLQPMIMKTFGSYAIVQYTKQLVAFFVNGEIVNEINLDTHSLTLQWDLIATVKFSLLYLRITQGLVSQMSNSSQSLEDLTFQTHILATPRSK